MEAKKLHKHSIHYIWMNHYLDTLHVMHFIIENECQVNNKVKVTLKKFNIYGTSTSFMHKYQNFIFVM